MEPRDFPYSDLGGGLNEGLPAGAIADNEFTRLVNFYPWGRKLIRRGGTPRISLVPFSTMLTGVFNYRPESAFRRPAPRLPPQNPNPRPGRDWTMFGTLTGFAKLDTNGKVVPIAGTLLAPDDDPWSMLQYKSIGYAMRRNAGLHRFTNLRFDAAGIAAPATAPTLTEGAAGSLTAADYQGVVTFGNQETGAESNPSDPGTVTLAASKQIDWSTIPVSTNAQVNMRRLYRTLPDAEGVYLFVGQIDDNTTTTFTDNVTIAEMGDFVSFDNGLPPAYLRFGDTWRERLWASEGTDLHYSEPFLPESWSGDFIRVNPDDGFQITAIRAVDKNRLIVAKHNRIEVITPAGTAFSKDTFSDSVGVVSAHTLKSAEGNLFWFSGQSFFASMGGGQPQDIASVKLKETLEHIDPARWQYAVSAIFPKLGWYLTALRVDNGYTPPLHTIPYLEYPNNVILCFNYRSGAWCKFEFPEGAPNFLNNAFDISGEEILQALFYTGHLYEFNRDVNDFVSFPVTGTFRTKAYRWNQLGLLTCIRRFFLLLSSTASQATFRLYKDQSDVATKTREDVLLGSPVSAVPAGASWKGVNMSTLGTPGSEWQLEVETTDQVEVEALSFGVVPLARGVRPR